MNEVSAIKSKKKTGGTYVYFRIYDSFLFDQELPVTIELAYLDGGCTQKLNCIMTVAMQIDLCETELLSSVASRRSITAENGKQSNFR